VEVEGRLSGDFESEHASDARRSAASTANKALDFIAHLRLSKTCFRIVMLSPSAMLRVNSAKHLRAEPQTLRFPGKRDETALRVTGR
jgi:hypothetical protein